LLNSLTGVKGPPGYAVRQNSKSDLVQGPVVLELEEQPIAPLALGLLYRRRSNRQAAAMMTIQEVLARPGLFEHEEALPMIRPRPATLAGIQERTQSGPVSNNLPPDIDSKQLDPFANREANRASSTGNDTSEGWGKRYERRQKKKEGEGRGGGSLSTYYLLANTSQIKLRG
jgi:hypothetical protein